MQKILKRGLSFLCVFALIASLLSVLPAKAAASPSIHLRIEGAAQTFLNKDVTFTEGDSLTAIVKNACDTNSPSPIRYTFDKSGYFSSFGGLNAGTYDNNAGWMYYVNDKAPVDSTDKIPPTSGDDVVFYYGTFDGTFYPAVTLNPQCPSVGQNVTVSVTSKVTQYDSSYNPIGTQTVNIADADVLFNGISYKTDGSGNATIKMPDAAGTYSLKVSKDRENNYPQIVRTDNIPVTVYTSDTIPENSGSRVVDINDPQHPVNSLDVKGDSPVSISLRTADNGSEKKGSIPSGFTGTVRDGYRVMKVEFPAGTTITGPSSWNSMISLPQILSDDSVTLPNGSARLVVEAGASGCDLQADQFVKITLPMQHGKKAGYVDASGTFHTIPQLSSNGVPGGYSANDGYFDDGYNLIVYTKHFSKFVSYLSSGDLSISDSTVDSAISQAAAYLNGNDVSDWSSFAVARAGFSAPNDYLSTAAQTLSDNQGDFNIPTDLEKMILGLKGVSADPENFNGMNLISKLASYQNLDKAGLNGVVFGLIALDSDRYTSAAGGVWNQSNLISKILSYQNPDGSFAYDKGLAGDPDMTAMAITALTPKISDSTVSQSVQSALNYLSAKQTGSAGYIPRASSTEASESTSQVIIALSTLGVDPASDSNFTKNGNTLIGNLLTYRQSDGGFAHSLDSGGSDIIATQQALIALTAYRRYEKNLSGIYDMSDVKSTLTSAPLPENPDTGSGKSMTAYFLLGAFALGGLALITPVLKIRHVDGTPKL